jgi:hypothetical protein
MSEFMFQIMKRNIVSQRRKYSPASQTGVLMSIFAGIGVVLMATFLAVMVNDFTPFGGDYPGELQDGV